MCKFIKGCGFIVRNVNTICTTGHVQSYKLNNDFLHSTREVLLVFSRFGEARNSMFTFTLIALEIGWTSPCPHRVEKVGGDRVNRGSSE